MMRAPTIQLADDVATLSRDSDDWLKNAASWSGCGIDAIEGWVAKAHEKTGFPVTCTPSAVNPEPIYSKPDFSGTTDDHFRIAD